MLAAHALDDEVMGMGVPPASWMPSITAVCEHPPTSRLTWYRTFASSETRTQSMSTTSSAAASLALRIR